MSAAMKGVLPALALVALASCSIEDNRPLERLDVGELYVAYRDNAAAADRRFADVRLQVTGKVDSVEAGPNGPELFLSAPRGGIVAVELGEEASERVSAMRRGDAVTVTCGGVHKKPTDVVFDLKACSL